MSKPMAEPKKEMPKKPKEYSLSEMERINLLGRDSLRKAHEYTASLILSDMDNFVDTDIRKRLGVSDDKMLSYNLKEGKVYVIDAPQIRKEVEEKKK